jgi:chorismate mutase / prephenate dehydratase
MKKLPALRRQIDALDDRLLALLDARARLAQEVYAVKVREAKGSKVKVIVPEREAQILRRLKQRPRKALPDKGVEAVFREVISVSRSLEAIPKIAYFGLPGSNTHDAAKRVFGSMTDYAPKDSIQDVFKEVQDDRSDYGVVPVENSTEGVITHTLDFLADSDLEVCSEIRVPIHHYLLNRSGKLGGVKRVLSHPQALGQCSAWLAKHLPLARTENAPSTSAAVQAVLKDRQKGSAAIGSKLAMEIYGLKAAASNIQDRNDNETRFFVIGKDSPKPTGSDKTSIMFSIRDHVGALAEAIAPFSSAGINLTAIESRPSRLKAWDYYFFVDFLGHKDDPRIRRVLGRLQKKVARMRVLGSYPAA